MTITTICVRCEDESAQAGNTLGFCEFCQAELDEPVECIEDHSGACKGKVELRASLTGTGTPIGRCDFHYGKRLDLQDDINARYGPDSDLPPSWFKGSYGGVNEYGERWSSDD